MRDTHHLRHTLSDNVMSESMMNRYIGRLRLGCAPGFDGIMGEHLMHTMGTPVTNHLSVMFTVCIKFGIVPSSCGRGLLIPLLKKTHWTHLYLSIIDQ
jgi:hypothetical protein